MKKYYTGIGSRDVPRELLPEITQIGVHLAQKGFVLRSGGADGCDTAFEEGAKQHKVRGLKQMYDIYLPWEGFNGRKSGRNYHLIIDQDIYEKAWEMASEMHPAWDKCSAGAQALHARNIYQVLGDDLATPSKFLICWAPISGDSIKGGTRTAWELAKANNVPCFNLNNPVHYARVMKLLEN